MQHEAQVKGREGGIKLELGRRAEKRETGGIDVSDQKKSISRLLHLEILLFNLWKYNSLFKSILLDFPGSSCSLISFLCADKDYGSWTHAIKWIPLLSASQQLALPVF